MAANIPVPKPQKPFEALKATLSPKSTANTNTAKSNLSRPNEMFTSFTKLPAILSKPNTQRSPQDVKNIINSIRNLELFKTHMKQIDDNDEFLMAIYESLNYEVVNQYDAVFHYGDPSDKLYIILQGNVDIYVPKTPDEINTESTAKQGPKKSLSQDSDQQKGILKTEKSNMILKPWSPLETDTIPKKSIAFKLDKSEPANSSSRKKSTTRNSQITSNVLQAIDIFSKFEDQLWLYINNGICTFKKSIAYGPGICLGEVNVSADTQKDTTAIATSQVHLMSITKAAYEKAIQTKVIDLAVSSYRLPGNNNISGVTHKRETSITKTIEQSSIEPKTLITENDHNFDTSPKEQTPNRISSHRKSKTMIVTMQAQTLVTSEEAETPSSKPLKLSLKMRTSMPEKAESGTNTVKTITESANALHKLFNDKILPSKSSPMASNQFKSSYRMQVSNLNTSKKNTNTHASMNSSIKLDPVYPPDPRKELNSRTYQSTEERLDSQGFPLPKKNGFTPYGSGDLDFPQFLTIKSHIFPVDDRRKQKPRAKFPHLKVQPQKQVVLPPKDYSRDEEVNSYFNLASMELSSPFAKKSVSLSLSLNTFTPYNPRVMRNDVRLDNLWAVNAQMQDIEEEGEKEFQPFQNNKTLVMSKHNLFRGKPGRAHLAPNYNIMTLGDRPFGKSTMSTMY